MHASTAPTPVETAIAVVPPTIVIADTPRVGYDPAECLATSAGVEGCDVERARMVDEAYAELEARARDLDGRAMFLGDVDEAELPALYAASAGFVLPSVAPSETFGVVQLEAMAARRPLVVSRASEGVVAVHDGAHSALLVPPGDPDALREAMLRVRDDAQLRDALVTAADALLRDRYVLDDRIAELEGLLYEATGRRTAA